MAYISDKVHTDPYFLGRPNCQSQSCPLTISDACSTTAELGIDWIIGESMEPVRTQHFGSLFLSRPKSPRVHSYSCETLSIQVPWNLLHSSLRPHMAELHCLICPGISEPVQTQAVLITLPSTSHFPFFFLFTT